MPKPATRATASACFLRISPDFTFGQINFFDGSYGLSACCESIP